MSLPEILRVFDSVEYDMPEYPDQPGMVKCCGLPVVMRGGRIIECSRCGRRVRKLEGSNWTAQ